MASGETLVTFTPQSSEPPASNPAYFDARNGHLVLAFDPATAWTTIFSSVMPRNYAGGGLTVRVGWTSATATSGSVKWNAQIERHQAGTDNIGTDSFAAAQTVTTAAPATSGILLYSDIAFTNGAQMDSLGVGESFRLKLTRDAANVADDMSGNAQVKTVELRET